MESTLVPLHPDELTVNAALVRRLLAAQAPEWAGLPLRPLTSTGSSNALFRLGEGLLVRMPRQPGGGGSITKEARWLPVVSAAVPVATPEVLLVGSPGAGYPERWSVVRWLAGETPTAGTTYDGLARDLADVVLGLGALGVTAEARRDPSLRWYRGEPLADLDADTRATLETCRRIDGLDLDVDAALELWAATMALPGARRTTEPRWLHADLLAENVLVRGGRLAAVLDFGALTLGDAAVDLVGAWELLDAAGREEFRSRTRVDEETWLLGRGWALALAVMTFPYYWGTLPGRCADRLVMAHEVLADAG